MAETIKDGLKAFAGFAASTFQAVGNLFEKASGKSETMNSGRPAYQPTGAGFSNHHGASSNLHGASSNPYGASSNSYGNSYYISAGAPTRNLWPTHFTFLATLLVTCYFLYVMFPRVEAAPAGVASTANGTGAQEIIAPVAEKTAPLAEAAANGSAASPSFFEKVTMQARLWMEKHLPQKIGGTGSTEL
ncbi:hypothetical protein ABW21_db0202011 [Orbilia brochopaga]|nr:hypothetical protein ABW21_db0202011 [Drechslerella brochopaga]